MDVNTESLKETGNLVKRSCARLDMLQRVRGQMSGQLTVQQNEIKQLLEVTRTAPAEQEDYVSHPPDSCYAQMIAKNERSIDAVSSGRCPFESFDWRVSAPSEAQSNAS